MAVSGRQQGATTQIPSPPTRYGFPLSLAEDPFWAHKGDVPYWSRQASASHNEVHDEEHEHVTMFLIVGNSDRFTGAVVMSHQR